MFFQEVFGRFASLANSIAAERVPRAAFLDDTHFAAEIDDLPIARNASAIEHIELSFFEWRRHLIFDYLYPGAPTDNIVTILQCANPANIHPHGRIKL